MVGLCIVDDGYDQSQSGYNNFVVFFQRHITIVHLRVGVYDVPQTLMYNPINFNAFMENP